MKRRELAMKQTSSLIYHYFAMTLNAMLSAAENVVISAHTSCSRQLKRAADAEASHSLRTAAVAARPPSRHATPIPA